MPCSVRLASTNLHPLPEWVGKRYVNAEVTVRLVDAIHAQPQASRIATACCKCKDCKKLWRTKNKRESGHKKDVDLMRYINRSLGSGLREVMRLLKGGLIFGSGWKMKAGRMVENRELVSEKR